MVDAMLTKVLSQLESKGLSAQSFNMTQLGAQRFWKVEARCLDFSIPHLFWFDQAGRQVTSTLQGAA